MGVVYEAEQISLARRVALKVLPFAATLDAKQLQRFKNEAQAAAQLHHQNIVPVYGVGCERGVHYYAMQFIDGQTLAALIQELRQSAGLQPADQAAAPSPALSLASELATGRWAPARRSPAQVGEPTGPFTPSPDAARGDGNAAGRRDLHRAIHPEAGLLPHCGQPGRAGGRGPGARPRTGGDAPGHQAGQPAGGPARQAVDHRLRAGRIARARPG